MDDTEHCHHSDYRGPSSYFRNCLPCNIRRVKALESEIERLKEAK